MTPINVYIILVIFLCFADHSSKKTAFNDVPPNSTWNEILVSSNDGTQRFSSQKLLVRNLRNSTKNFLTYFPRVVIVHVILSVLCCTITANKCTISIVQFGEK